MVIRLWDARTGQERHKLSGHTSWISSLAFAPDGMTLASGGADKTVRLWDPATMTALATLEGFTEEVMCLAFSPDGQLLAAGSGEMATGSGTPFTRHVRQVAGGEVRVWNLAKRQPAGRLPTHQNGILSLAFAADSRTLATAGVDRTVKIWDVPSGHERSRLTNFPGPVFGLAFSRDGTRLATASWYPRFSTGEIRLWETRDWSEVIASRLRTPSVTCLALSPDGQTLLTGGTDQTVRRWDLAKGVEQTCFRGHTDVVWALTLAPDGRSFASASWDRTVKVWDFGGSRVSARFKQVVGYSVSFSADSRLMAFAGSGRVCVWDHANGKLALDLRLPGVNDTVAVLSPDGRALAAAGSTNVVYLVHPQVDGSLRMLPGHKLNVSSLAFSPNGRTLASGSEDSSIVLWDPETGQKRASLAGHTHVPGALVFTPDGRTLFSGTANEQISWDLATGTPRQTIDRMASRIALSPDGTVLAHKVRTNNGVVLRDPRTDRELAFLSGHKDGVYNLAFAPDGKTLATASWDGTTKLWRIPTGQLLLTIPSAIGVTWCAAFSPNGQMLAIGSGAASAGQMTVLRAATPAEVDAPDQSVPARSIPKTGLYPVPRSVLTASLEKRELSAPAALIDLTHYYNGSLTEGWIPSSAFGTARERNLEELPRGVQEFAGFKFDVRGLIQLAGRSLNGTLAASYPTSVEGIQVGRKCQRLHFLHGTGWRVRDGTTIGHYIVHYADGQRQNVPIVYGENVRDWWHNPAVSEPVPGAEVAWTGKNAAVRNSAQVLRIYRFSWRNPRPEATVQTIDFTSAESNSSPFLLAITVE
jgi:WD40 repeat protein